MTSVMDRRAPRPRILLAALALAMLVTLPLRAEPCPAVPLDPLAAPVLRAAMQSGAPATIVALGSSSTRGSGASSEARTYPVLLDAALRAAFPGAPLRVLNRGVGGEDAAEMLARLDRDVLAERPQLVIWQAGGNGAMRGRDPEEFRALLAAGIARLREAGADVILMDNQRAPRILAAPAAPRFEAAMAALARSLGIGLLARGRLMDAWARAGVPPEALLVGDGIHHNDRGYACLATALAGGLVAALGSPEGPVLAARR